LDTVLTPKADTAWHLHELTAHHDLARFILFSAASGILGGAGQGDYAAANAFLDALAHHRYVRGLPATSLAWGLWAERSGMTGHLGDADLARMARGGIRPLSAEQALGLLDAAMDGGHPHLVPIRLDPAALLGSAEVPAVLRGLVRPARRTAGSAAGDGGPPAARLAALPAAERGKALVALVREHAAAVLGHRTADAVDALRAFREAGFDSLTAVELRNRLNAATGLKLPATLVFDYPTPQALGEHLAELLAPAATAAAADARSGPATGPATGSATAGDDPVVIVGMGCRLPGGVTDPGGLWRLLADGGDAVTGFPMDRGWPTPSGGYVPRGGFVSDVSGFDADFFGINPREALAMDPQQRLLLETVWETIESAGADPAALRGGRTGVFVGAARQDYATLDGASVPAELEGYLVTGNAASVISGRVSYTFGFEGPAVTVDTACSSSLVALHLGVRALQRGECDLALAGGVTVMATPGVFGEFGRQGGLAADGRSKAFADAADGFGMAEGVGMLLLERLSDARRNGRRILAVIRGSAVNQDGASNGLTAPNGPSQERVIRAALQDAGLSPADVDAVEAHGTGTRLGDPIEAQALMRVYGQDRDRPLLIGSLKSNIGHTQAAAGAAGVIKMVLALRHETLPATLHVDSPTSQVDWTAGDVELLTEARPWPRDGRPRRAGVSSFGVSGTNAHVILEEAAPEPATPEEAGEPAGEPVFLLSARTPEALRDQAARLRGHLATGADPRGVAAALARRTSFEHRAVALGARVDAALAALVAGDADPDLVTGTAPPGGAEAVWVFPGQGSQWPGMGLRLAEESPVFAARLRECADALRPHVDWDPHEALGDPAALDRVDVVQPALWAVMVSLAGLWESYGHTPAAVVGHSQGEIAAATVAGALTLADGAAIVALRSRLIGERLAGHGGMASVALPADDAAELIGPWSGDLHIAALNSPEQTIVSGGTAALDEFLAACDARGVRTRRVPVDYASHSPHVDAIGPDLLAALDGIAPRPTRVPLYSTLTDAWASGDELDAGYWLANLRYPVRLAPALARLAAEGHGVFTEISPHPTLTAALAASAPDAVVVATLHRDEPGLRQFHRGLARAHAHGVRTDWRIGGRPGEGVPTYPFQRRRYWLTAAPAADVASAGLVPATHPLLGAAVRAADSDELVLTGRLDAATRPWLADHAVHGTTLLPGTAFLDLALHAADAAGLGAVEELTLEAPLALPEAGAVRLQVVVRPEPGGAAVCAIYSAYSAYSGADDDEPVWTRHATGILAAAPAAPVEPVAGAWPPPGAVELPVDGMYDRLAEGGFAYGPAFRGLRAAWRHGDDVYAEVALPDGERADGFTVHPALLDAALHTGALAAVESGEGRLPFAWTGVTSHASGATRLRVRLRPAGTDGVSLHACDPDGRPVLTVTRLVSRPVAAERIRAARGAALPLHTVTWRPVPASRLHTRCALLDGPDAEELAAGLRDAGAPVEVVADLDAAARSGAGLVVLACPDGGATPDGVVAGVIAGAVAQLEAVQRFLADERFAESRLAVVTRGAVAAADGDTLPGLGQATAWGLGRSAQREHPGRIILADLDAGGCLGTALAAALAADEPQVAARAGAVLVPRLTRAAREPADAEPAEHGTVVVTGGLGGLGAVVARHLVAAHGVRRLVLAGRSGPDAPGAAALTAELEGLGAQVTVAACDVADREQVAALLAAVPGDAPVTGVVHAAGVLDDGLLTGLTPERLAAVLRPKVAGALHLHELAGPDLNMFVLFSSAAGVLGSPGQANYAAANAFLDALAAHRAARGLAGQALAWGLWADAGGVTAGLDAATRRRMARGGLVPLATPDGLALFDAALRGPAASVPIALDLAALRASRADGAAISPVLADLAGPAPAVADGTSTYGGGAEHAAALAAKLAALTETERTATLLRLVRTHAAAVLGHAGASAIDPQRGFLQSGFDSLTAVELRNRLTTATGLRPPATLIFDHPTPQKLAEYLASELPGGPPAPGPDERDAVGEAPLLAGLDRLDAELALLDADARARVTARLLDVAARWRHGGPEGVPGAGSDGGPGERDAVAGRLQEASAEELFAFIQQEFGKS
ncbi:SDR family NAD(P)-dependent oxidoreductase, partial [Thermopolyspora sp. NPDC052614]|uniref:SDR family NAD(P)-dependent oxidoreductase n=1 Tax=Thermopolyspora sp. NPDC052614 TaxID=3155682 RepID=UPI00341A4C9A